MTKCLYLPSFQFFSHSIQPLLFAIRCLNAAIRDI